MRRDLAYAMPVYSADIAEFDLGDGIAADVTVEFWIDPAVRGSYRWDASSDVDYVGRPAAVDGIKDVYIDRVYRVHDDSDVYVSTRMECDVRDQVTATVDHDMLLEAAVDVSI